MPILYKNITDFITERMNVSVVPKPVTCLATTYVDFTTGDNYTVPASTDMLAALKRYHELCK